MSRPFIHRSLRPLAKLAHDQGWILESTGRNHVKWSKPGHPPVFTGGTPSDQRALQNARALLRRAGLKLEE